MKSLASSAAAIFALAILASACGDDAPAAPADSTVASLPSLAEWCATFAADRPAAASPNPDGRELEVLDIHIEGARQLAAGAPGVTEAAKEAAGQVAEFYAVIRQRVADGEELPDVLKEVWFSDDIDGPYAAAELLDAEADALC